MKQLKTILLSLFLLPSTIFAQNAALETNFAKALENKTRTETGVAGENYWQNYSVYQIDAKLFPAERKIVGTEIIKYQNNSPNELELLVIKLFQNLYKIGYNSEEYIADSDQHNGVEIVKVEMRKNSSEEWQIAEGDIDYCNFFLNKLPFKILPNSTVEVKISWSLFLPEESNIRMGTYNQTDFFVAYWYPQIAVYDDIDGWDITKYDGLHELYFEWADYNVNISVPKEYIVWGTGVLQNPQEVLSSAIYEKYVKALNSSEVVEVLSENDIRNNIVKTAQNEWNTWTFKASNVVDFCFASSKSYRWDAAELQLTENDSVFVSAAYSLNSNAFSEVAEMTKITLSFFSTQMPAYQYPYPTMTIFNGGPSGMEYPMMVNNNNQYSSYSTFDLVTHEVAHSYFPFITGINQTKYAWMDEGWAMFLPTDLVTELFPNQDPVTESASNSSYLLCSKSEQVPLMRNTQLETSYNYFLLVYYKAHLAYYTLQQTLGNELFSKALHTYIGNWDGKHPVPYDFFNTFNTVTDSNLDWFWKPWFFETASPDLAVTVSNSADKYLIEVKNVGGLPVGFELLIQYKSGKSQKISYSAIKWENSQTFVIERSSSVEIKSVSVVLDKIGDCFPQNNKVTL